MEVADFRRILTTFADKPADVDDDRGTLLVQIREEVIEAKIVTRRGSLHVIEDGTEYPAALWIIERIARLQLLADRIIEQVPTEPHFVDPSGDLLDQLDVSPSDDEKHVDQAGACVLEVLDRRPAGTSSVLYLTSDAGEGKTTLIQHLARVQAQKYKQKQTDWLIVPISLGGRTFMRFDDVIVGALVNTLRFQLLYHEAFIELVKMGVIVPALDGFEEMFVENAAGDAISALGNLMDTLSSSGSIILAARKAYFEYKSFQASVRLFDSMKGQSVAFARLALDRWDREHFISYSIKRGIDCGEEIFDEVATRLNDPKHPLLTRAVLVQKLLDIAADTPDREAVFAKIEADPKDFFRQFVGSIITREHRIWIDKSGEPAQPLLTEEEHYELLAAIALEMWTSNTELVRPDVLEFVAEMYADSKKKTRVITGQIVERIKQHALIVKADTRAAHFRFDHQEFYHFFLGETIGRTLVESDAPTIRHAFRQGVLPQLTIDTAARYATRHGTTPSTVVETANSIFGAEPRASLVKDNLSGLIMRLIDYAGGEHVSVRHGSFPVDSLSARRISEVEFHDSYFQSSSLSQSSLIKVRFENCEFEQLGLSDGAIVNEVVLHDCQCTSVIPAGNEVAVFAPGQVEHLLSQAGFAITSTVERPPVVPHETEERLQITERMCRVFLRSTGVTESIFRQRLGNQAAKFFEDVLPRLEQSGAIAEVPFRGAGRQRYFRLQVPLHEIQDAIEQADGGFERFLEHLSRVETAS